MKWALEEIDRRRLYRVLGFPSLFAYAVNALGLSESTAYQFITVARKIRDVAAFREARAQQELTVAKASRIVPAINAENAAELIAFARTHTTRETDQEVARRSPERSRPLKSVTIAAGTLRLLKRAQSLIASRERKPVELERVLEVVVTDYLERHDPVKKAERATKRRAPNSVQTESERIEILLTPGNSERSEFERSEAPRPAKRKRLTAREKHAVFARDRGRCTFVDSNGERCLSDRWLDIHHVRAVSQGGGNDPSNLTTLCSYHHDLVHQLGFAFEGQIHWIRSPMRSYQPVTEGPGTPADSVRSFG